MLGGLLRGWRGVVPLGAWRWLGWWLALARLGTGWRFPWSLLVGAVFAWCAGAREGVPWCFGVPVLVAW